MKLKIVDGPWKNDDGTANGAWVIVEEPFSAADFVWSDMQESVRIVPGYDANAYVDVPVPGVSGRAVEATLIEVRRLVGKRGGYNGWSDATVARRLNERFHCAGYREEAVLNAKGTAAEWSDGLRRCKPAAQTARLAARAAHVALLREARRDAWIAEALRTANEDLASLCEEVTAKQTEALISALTSTEYAARMLTKLPEDHEARVAQAQYEAAQAAFSQAREAIKVCGRNAGLAMRRAMLSKLNEEGWSVNNAIVPADVAQTITDKLSDSAAVAVQTWFPIEV